MDKRYSDSLIPIGIGKSFLLGLVSILFLGAIAGILFADRINFQQLGGIPLLIIFFALLVGPRIYIRKTSRFETGKSTRKRFDGFGTIQGLRGAFFRLLIYDDGIEVRAFYHRYYIPFEKMDNVSIEEGYFGNRLNIVSGIDGVPDYIISSGKQFMSLAFLIKKKATANKANSAEAENRGVD